MAKKAQMVRYWLKSSREDLRAATTLLGGGHFRLAMFCCHLAMEKALKAVLQHQTGRLQPRLHDLRTLLAHTGLAPPARLKRGLERLAAARLPSRQSGPLATVRVAFRVTRVCVLLV